MRRLAGFLLLAASLVPAGAMTADVPSEAQWAQPWFTRLDARFPGQGFHARWDFHRCACGDALIKAEETLPEGISRGEMILVGGRVLLVRGFDSRGEGDELRTVIDSPMLMLQLLFVLMQKTAPEGPAALIERRELGYADALYPLQLETGGAQGGFPAPWGVSGLAYRFEDGSHRFDLEFGFNMQVIGEPASRTEIHLSGMLDYREENFPVNSDLPLEAWTVIPLIDDDAGMYEGAATLGALREQVRVRKSGN
jgi:hypothetical protein